MRNAIEQFCRAIRAAGLVPPDTIEADGSLHRFSSNGARDDDAGWYALHAEGIPTGVFGDWRTGVSQHWRADIGRALTYAEEAAHRGKTESLRRAREAATAHNRAAAAKKAAAIWQAATAATTDNPYLSIKAVSPVATVRQIDTNAAVTILGYAPKANEERLAGCLLVVPIKVGDTLSSLELVDGARRKSALYGGAKAGGYWAAQPLPDGDGTGLTFQYGEGVATTLTAREANGHVSIAALSAGNLPSVAKYFRNQYPAAVHIVLADLVKGTGAPNSYASDAAQSINGLLAIPAFGVDRLEEETDFNDMAARYGLHAVYHAIAGARAPAGHDHKCEHDIAIVDSYVGGSWPDPLPLMATLAREAYPLDALPETMLAAVQEVAGFVKAPLPLVVSSALAALSVAIQTHIDAKRAERLAGPVGLFLLTIADSGERKSTCDGFFMKAIRDYEREQKEAAKPILKDNKAAIEAWEAKCTGIKEKLRRLARECKPTDSMEFALRELEHDKPIPIRVPRLLYADATPEALAFALATQWPSGAVVSAEAGIVFGSHGMSKDSVMRNLAVLNQLWDGTSLTVDRRSTESFTVRGARLTVALQVQEPALREFFTRSGALARGTGFLARFLVAWPESTQGFRPFTEAPENWPNLAAFNRRIDEILNQPAPIDEDGALIPAMLSLTVDAKAAWVAFHDAIEGELRAGGDLYDVRDVASKTADNAVRLAALFWAFDSKISRSSSSNITVENIDSASRIVAWHLREAQRFFGELAKPTDQLGASRLDNWLVEVCCQERIQVVPMQRVQQFGPGSLRSKEAIETAMRDLQEAGRARLIRDGNRKSIAVNPALVKKREA